jgi:hypothetical protein
MNRESQQPELPDEKLADLRRCRFEQRQFELYPSLKAIESTTAEGQWYEEVPYHGQPFDPTKYRLIDGGWNHEHCYICWATITAGDRYWPNIDIEAGGEIDLCEACDQLYLAEVRD